ncbi:MAG: PHP domain-containing protein [Fusobacteriaceae bacterium]
MLILKYEGADVLLDQKTKRIQVKVKKAEFITEALTTRIEEIKDRYKKYSIELMIDEKYKVDNLNVNEIYKLSKHLNQKITLVVKIVSCEEKKLKSGKNMYSLMMELPGKKKFIKGKIFTEGVFTIEEGSYYHVTGKVVKEDSNYIKKNELSLGKTIDYSLMVNALEKHSHEVKVQKNKYSEPRQELHSHTMFSKKDGFITTNDIEKAFIENKIDQIAITDHGAAFAFIPFTNDLKKKFAGSNKKLILGCEFYAVDTEGYDLETNKLVENLELKLDSLKESTKLEEDLDALVEKQATSRAERDVNKKLSARKTISEEEKVNALELYNFHVNELNELQDMMREIKNAIKERELLITNTSIELDQRKGMIGKTHDISRDHLTILIKSQDDYMDYRGEQLKYNPGILTLYKLITKSYKEYFASPTIKAMKMYGKRPTIPYHEIFKEGVREHFVINSACAFGKHMKLAVEGRWSEFKIWIKNLDSVELQPLHNNSYMVKHKDYPEITSIDDVKMLHRRIYEECKEVGIPVIFTSDAHVNDKEDRDIRSVFKSGYISGIKAQVAEGIAKKIAKGIEVEEEQPAEEDDFSVDTQPYILSKKEAEADLRGQGFSEEQIKEIMDNTKMIADRCANAFEITLAPDKMFLGDFPGINVKEEVPRLALEALIKKYSKDGTKKSIDSKILERYDEEMEAVQSTGYEILYYIAYWSCRKSEEMGYFVGSRGLKCQAGPLSCSNV